MKRKTHCPECQEDLDVEAEMLSKKVYCQNCGANFTAIEIQTPVTDKTEAAPPGVIFGGLLILGGMACTLYFIFGYEDAVSTMDGDVVNVGLLGYKIIGSLGGMMGCIAGIVLIGFSCLARRMDEGMKPQV